MIHKKVTLVSSPLLVALLWQFRDEPLAACTCISGLAGLATWCVVPGAVSIFKRAGLSGADLAKPNQPVLAESMGVVAAMIYLVATFLFIPAQFRKWWSTQEQTELDMTLNSFVFPYDRLGEYLSALLSLQSMVFLGFADDVLDLRWRFKLILPTIASVPILIVYYIGYGVTHVVVPVFMRSWLDAHIVDLGMLYYVYIGMMAVFCTNAINILAGINGVEVGQSIVIALSIIAKDIAYIISGNPDGEYYHLFTLYLLLPFVAVSCALYYWNVYPARVFVGDTYCYFSGMTFAVCGILGHFSKTLMLLFIPQIFNFVYSAPQIFGLVPCPRHRLPKMVVGSPLSRKTVARLQQEIDAENSGAASDASSDGGSATGDASNPSILSDKISSDHHGTLFTLHKSISTAMTSFAKAKANKPKRSNSTLRRSRSQSLRASGSSPNAGIYMVASRTSLEGAKPLGLLIIKLYEHIGIADIERDDQGNIMTVNNLTLLNLVLVLCHRLTESQLNNRILLIQVLNSVLAFFIRYRLSHLFYF
ncbi:tunicamycin resistance protein [Coemansia spiralis]|uniref:UDP-N-acetylglucosamine--dolichyl-phosphate N-acetylglucosaminephosphotransferase n=2 Tax=Coemansia TaxID=4863 RepID=A0A9W8GAZ2_9FUNG|nr:glycosyl transferase family 4-domain-containing protein [Coemansia spiralis]KAJ1989578.1 tunicamycin resistance protein [Coemansia umbellata]KAJ2625706.1 tunicamycin resistance protein [Coemansia sp. RSA 1358]KAJ2678524.1 tunicamycin resistance protein [Coemansia spiralis]